MAEADRDKKTILVVEDDPTIIALHRDFLSDFYTAVIMPNGKKAISYVRKKKDIHLAVVDFRLPDISGIEVLKEIKKIMPFIPVIFMTAYGNEEVAVKAFRCGARDYIKKPFIYDEFLKRVEFCLSLSRIEQVIQKKSVLNDSEAFNGRMVPGDTWAKKNYYIREACKFIQNNYSTEIDLERVADLVQVSKYHFSRTFRETTGSTFQSYLNRIRIEAAAKLLTDNALSVTDVGYCVGYADLRQFERMFKKVIGSTPKEFRNLKLFKK